MFYPEGCGLQKKRKMSLWHFDVSPPSMVHAPAPEAMSVSVSFFPCEKAYLISYLFVCFFFFLDWKVGCPRKRKLQRGLQPGLFWAVQHLCFAAYLCTFCLQSLFKEGELLLISSFCFNLSPLSPFFSSADDIRPPSSHLLIPPPFSTL